MNCIDKVFPIGKRTASKKVGRGYFWTISDAIDLYAGEMILLIFSAIFPGFDPGHSASSDGFVSVNYDLCTWCASLHLLNNTL